MMNRICSICKQYVNDIWTVELKDDKDRYEISGCKEHIDELYDKIQKVEGLHKKSVNKVLKEIKYGGV